MDSILEALESWKPFRAVVLGDLMLDELVYGDAEKLSADAPVPVLRVRERDHRPGGAANLCLDLAAMMGSVDVLGVVGDDAAGATLRSALERSGVSGSGVVTDPSRPTTQKQNLIGLAAQRHPQKMFRLDTESREPLSSEIEGRLTQLAEKLIPGADVVCIEDYNKGVCSTSLCRKVIDIARREGVDVLVDPAAIADYSKYSNATAITPNRTEAEKATGLTTSTEAEGEQTRVVAREILEALRLDVVVLTLDRHGALLHQRDHVPEVIPTKARAVYDVTGAGDMVLAALAASRANNLGWRDATRLANAAAGMVVEIFGVEPIPIERIAKRLASEADPARGKLHSSNELSAVTRDLQSKGKRVVLTNGCFDVIHSGHVTLIDRAREQGDFLIVAINSDESVRRLKGETRPINPETDRVRVLAALASVDAIAVFSEDTPIPLLEQIKPDVLVKGGDYTPEQVVGKETVEASGGQVRIVPLVEGRSSTQTIARAGDSSELRSGA